MEGVGYGFWLVVAVTVAYVGTSIDMAYRGQYPFAIVFGSYALANIGMLWSMK